MRLHHCLLRAFAVVSAFSLLGGGVSAAEKNADDDPYMKTAVARTKVEITFRDAAPVFDPVTNGCNAAWTAAGKSKNQIDDLLTKAVEKEQDRGGLQDETFITACEQRLNKIEELWTEFDEQIRPTLESGFDKAREKFDAAGAVLTSLMEQEQNWKTAGVDLTALETVYAALGKRAAELTAEAEQVIKGAKEKQAVLENEVKGTEKFLSGRPAGAKVAVPEAPPPAPAAE